LRIGKVIFIFTSNPPLHLEFVEGCVIIEHGHTDQSTEPFNGFGWMEHF
jgi:hypothetical protein